MFSRFLARNQIFLRPSCNYSKICSAKEAVIASGLKDQSKLLVGGFGLSGIPMTVIKTIRELNYKDLWIVSNNCGVDEWGLGILLKNKQLRRLTSSYVGENKEFERQYLFGEIEVELTPQGNLAERLRAGAAGIPAFFTPTAANTISGDIGGSPILHSKDGKSVLISSKPKEYRMFDNKKYVLEEAITGDVSIIKAWKADEYGNLQWRYTSRNFNPMIAAAGKYCIAEVEEIVPIGSIHPDQVHLSGVYVKKIVKTDAEKKIEFVTVTQEKGVSFFFKFNIIGAEKEITDPKKKLAAQQRERIVRRAALELKDGMAVNLGIGIPTLCTQYVPKEADIMFQSENGALGAGPFPKPGEEDADLINAGKQTISLVPGSSTFSSSDSFAMIRGGHIDITILGALQVSKYGDLANWIIPGKMVKGMGGAMDLVSAPGAKVVVTMTLASKGGEPKILQDCTLPLTGKRCVDLIVTEMGVFSVDSQKGVTLIEIAPDVSVEDITKNVGCEFEISKDLCEMKQA